MVQLYIALRHITTKTATTTGCREESFCIEIVILHNYSIKIIDFIDCSKI